MCKQQTLYFSCGHVLQMRESTCNFRKTIKSLDGRTAWRACQSSSYMSRNMKGPCKRCHFEGKQLEIQLMAEDLRCGTIDHLPELASLSNADLDEIDEWEASCIEELMKSLPRCDPNRKSRHLNTPSWNSRRNSKRTRSLLCIEVKPEDVVGHWDWESNITNDAAAVDTPSTAAWPSDDDDGWAAPGEATMVYEDYDDNMDDEPQQDVYSEQHYDTSIGCTDIKTVVDSDVTNSGSSWGCLSII